MCAPLLALHRAGLLKAAAHITGGGLPGNLPRVLPDGMVAALTPTWPVPPVFGWLARTGGVDAEEMLRVFNCGVGMALVVSDAGRGDPAAARREGETVSRIGDRSRAADRPAAAVRFDAAGWLAGVKRRIAILISGRGSNMAALIAAAARSGFPAEIALVLSNRPDAAGLAMARAAGIAAEAIDHRALRRRPRGA